MLVIGNKFIRIICLWGAFRETGVAHQKKVWDTCGDS